MFIILATIGAFISLIPLYLDPKSTLTVIFTFVTVVYSVIVVYSLYLTTKEAGMAKLVNCYI